MWTGRRTAALALLIATMLIVTGILLAEPGEAPDDVAPSGGTVTGKGGPGEVIDLQREGPFPFYPGLYVLEVETGRVRRLLEQPAYISGPERSYEWSADSEWIVSAHAGDRASIGVVATDGSLVRSLPGEALRVERLRNGSFIVSMGWTSDESQEHLASLDAGGALLTRLDLPWNGRLSPDGRRVAFYEAEAEAEAEQGLWVIDEAGVSRKVWTRYTSAIAWSPDGSLLALTTLTADDRPAGVIMRHDGTEPEVEIEGVQDEMAWSPDGALLAAVVNRDDQPAIVLHSRDAGGQPRELAVGQQPSWSADGQHVAFVRDGELWRIGAAGGPEERLVSPAIPVIHDPRWSPDGRFIAFRALNGGGEILAVDADGTNERYLGVGTQPRWSPDGNRVAFLNAAGPAFRSGLYTMDRNGGRIASVLDLFIGHVGPVCHGNRYDWSPDGKQIAAYDGNNGRLWLADSSGTSSPRYLGEGSAPAWAAGGRLGYLANGRSCSLHELDVATGNARSVLDGAMFPAWSPDGSHVALLLLTTGRGVLTVIDAANPAVQVTIGEGRAVAWSPDGKRLAYFREDRPVRPPPEQKGVIRVVSLDAPTIAVAEIPVDGYLRTIAFAPNGERLAFDVMKGAGSSQGPGFSQSLGARVYVVDLDEPDGAREVARGHTPSWSPDSETIVFARDSQN